METVLVRTRLSVVSVAVKVTVSAALSSASNCTRPDAVRDAREELPTAIGWIWTLPLGAPWRVTVFPANGSPN